MNLYHSCPESGTGVDGNFQQMQAIEGKRLLHLDALRGVAILLVVYHHTGLRFPGAPRGFVGDFFVGVGWAGVDIFFAISGYLITGILLRGFSPGFLRSFYIKRFFRIIPLYTLALVLFVFASLFFGQEREILSRLWINILFLTAWVIPFLGENGVPYKITWSVSVEEFAYLLLGALSLMGAARFRFSLYWLIVGAIVIRLLSVVFFLFDPVLLYYFAPARIDAIAFGGLAACIHSRSSSKQLLKTVLSFSIIIVTLALFLWRGREDAFAAVVGYSALAAAAAYLVMTVAKLDSNKATWVTKILADVGLVSYFIYLFHVFMIATVQRIIPAHLVPQINLLWIATIAALMTYIPARLSWKYFEYPLLKFGRRVAVRSQAQS
jgi:peptidoglycan/LPS O-acetylase OafA/YrhL